MRIFWWKDVMKALSAHLDFHIDHRKLDQLNIKDLCARQCEWALVDIIQIECLFIDDNYTLVNSKRIQCHVIASELDLCSANEQTNRIVIASDEPNNRRTTAKRSINITGVCIYLMIVPPNIPFSFFLYSIPLYCCCWSVWSFSAKCKGNQHTHKWGEENDKRSLQSSQCKRLLRIRTYYI